MFRILNAEAYKLRKSKSFFVCCIAMVCFTILLIAMVYIADNIQKGNIGNGTAGITITSNGTAKEFLDNVSLMEMLQQIFGGSMLSCTLAVFISIFVTKEYGSGMIKNIVGKGCPRASIYLSKLLVTVAASFCITSAGVLSMLLGGRILLGERAFDGGFWNEFLSYTGIQIALMAAMAAVFMLVSEVCRTVAAGISLNIGIIIFSVLFINGLDLLFADSSFRPSDIWLIGQTEHLPLDGITSGFAAKMLIVAAVWFVAAALLGILHFYKTDIK